MKQTATVRLGGLTGKGGETSYLIFVETAEYLLLLLEEGEGKDAKCFKREMVATQHVNLLSAALSQVPVTKAFLEVDKISQDKANPYWITRVLVPTLTSTIEATNYTLLILASDVPTVREFTHPKEATGHGGNVIDSLANGQMDWTTVSFTKAS